MTEPGSDAPRPDEPAEPAVGRKPVAKQTADEEPAPEGERQTAETIRSISRLEESN